MAKTKPTPSQSSSFAPDWLAAGAERARALVDEAGERGAELIGAWVACKNAAAVAEVASDDGGPALARKAARRGVNVLKSRGVAIPERAPAPRAALQAAETHEAWFRPPDAAGTSAFTLGARGAGGRYRLIDVIIKEGVGLVSVAGMEMSRTQLRETFDGIEQRFGHGPAPVPIAWARARIAAARAENAVHGKPLPLGLDQHDHLLGTAPASPPSHPADDAGLAWPGRDEAVARSGTLHAEPELRGWLPEPSAMQELLRALDQEKEALIGADRATTEAKVVAMIERMTDTYFTPDARAKTALRMKDAAISLLARGETARAADLIVAARAAAATDAAALAASAIPFLRGLFEKAFGLAAARAARAGG
jgi:hypothetical protein